METTEKIVEAYVRYVKGYSMAAGHCSLLAGRSLSWRSLVCVCLPSVTCL